MEGGGVALRINVLLVIHVHFLLGVGALGMNVFVVIHAYFLHISGVGWRAKVQPADHPASLYEFDVLVGADGRRNTLDGGYRVISLQQIQIKSCSKVLL